MYNLRKDPIKKNWILVQDISEGIPRAKPVIDRPNDRCVFCPGNELQTPPEIFSYKNNSDYWLLRVIPHKNPKLKVEVELAREGVGIYDTISTTGAHEIIVEYPQHGIHFTDIPINNIENIFRAYRDRISDLYRDKRLKYVLIYRTYSFNGNTNSIVGHPHSRLLALPIIPKHIKEELHSAKNYFKRKERCLFCDIISDTIRTEDRVIYEDDFFLAFAPFAPRSPFEIWIAPKRHSSDYENINDDEITQLSFTMKTTLDKIKKGLNNPPFKFALHTAPNKFIHPGYWGTISDDYHWHMEIKPNLFDYQGFEFCSEFYITPTLPEDYANYLKSIE